MIILLQINAEAEEDKVFSDLEEVLKHAIDGRQLPLPGQSQDRPTTAAKLINVGTKVQHYEIMPIIIAE